MGLKEDLQGALGVTIADAIRGMIDGKYILGYGIVEEVMADGIVMVSPSVITKFLVFWEPSLLTLFLSTSSRKKKTRLWYFILVFMTTKCSQKKVKEQL